MKRSKSLVIIAVVAATLFSVPLVYAARGGRHDGGFGPEGRVLKVLRHVGVELELTDQQKEQIKQIALDVRTQNKQYRASMKTGFRGAADILVANPDNVNAALSLLEQQDAQRAEMRQNIVEGVSRALKVLSAEQRTKLAELMDKHAARVQQLQ